MSRGFFFFLFLKGSKVSLVRHRYYKFCIMAMYGRTIAFIFVDYNIATRIFKNSFSYFIQCFCVSFHASKYRGCMLLYA